MSKIFDALENARKKGDSEVKLTEAWVPPSVSLPTANAPVNPDFDMEQEMVTLYQAIVASLPNIEHRTVLFIGSRSNEGTSTMARELAKTVSLRMEKHVLLIDFDRSRPDLHVYTRLEPEVKNDDDIVNGEESADGGLCRVEDSSLYVMPLFQRTMATPRAIESAREKGFWEPLKTKFDLIIVDSPPVTMFPDGPAVVSQVDGVVLVVEAEKTRWQVALSVKEKIIKSGGNILGIIFNKRRYYIPQWIYKKL